MMNPGTVKRLLFYGLQNPGSLFQKKSSYPIILDRDLGGSETDHQIQSSASQPELESETSWTDEDTEQLNYHHRLLNTDSALAAVRPGYLTHEVSHRSSPSIQTAHSTLVSSGLLIAVCSISAIFVLFALLATTYYIYKKRNNSLWSQQQSHYYGTTNSGPSCGSSNKVLLFGRDIIPFQQKQPYSNGTKKSTPTPVRSPSSGQVNPFNKKSPSPTGAGVLSSFGNDANVNGSKPNNNKTTTFYPGVNSASDTTNNNNSNGQTKQELDRSSWQNTGICGTNYNNNITNHYNGTTRQNEQSEAIDSNNNSHSKVLGSIENIGQLVKSGETGNDPITSQQQQSNPALGQLHFKLKYSYEKKTLCLVVIRCSDLIPSKDHSSSATSLTGNGGSSGNGGPSIDPYVKMQLLPEKQHKAKTRVLRKTQNPIYNEEFTFYGITANYLENLVVHFVILNFDRFSRDEILGEVVCKLNQFEFDSLEKQITLVRDIAPRGNKLRIIELGELLVSLCYQPIANRLSVVILKARNLPKMDLTGLCDPYVKIYVFHNKQRIFKKRTHVKKRTLSPVFNESFVFDIPPDEGLENIQLQFLVFDHDRVTRNELIGKIEVGAGSLGNSPTAEKHWYDVIKSPRRQIAEWHKLKESN